MYDELVKQLRELPHLLFVQLHGHEDIVYKASVAIEALNKQIDELQKQVAYWQAQLTKSMCGETLAELERPRWIPVTEGLPKMRDAGILKKLGINLRSDKCLIVISDGKDQIVDNDAELRDGKWHSDTLRWLSAGKKTFEVTHWQPLPKPPKGEEEA